MKATQKDFASIAPKAAAQARVFFFCGNDDAGIQDAAHRIAGLLRDPGERIEMSGAELKRDPAKLDDEARSVSLFGDSRHIWVRASGDEVFDALEILLASDVAGCPVIIQAANASDKSKTAKLLEKRSDSLLGVFYPPDLRSVTQTVRMMADSEGVPMDQALAQRIASAVGLDTRLAASEIAKLALYLDAAPERPRPANAEAFEKIGAKTEDEGFATLVNVVLSGESAKVPEELRRMFDLGLNAVGLLLAFERRVAQLAQLAARMDPRDDVGVFIEGESAARRIFWKDAGDLSKQLRIWRGKKLERLVARLMALHRLLMSHSQDAELLLGQGLAEIARAAARRD
ncbi:DNA polymerase III subunit delta [Novosphingobium umbonatum]|uniref:DNA-directed DNA polymerase n=1 Tax=Novosphingobium umbonatum TaxID=1908524 RepID=A0A437N4X3_9SPHN|nr:DNA polymerase III subunit delta [Novosphingobium umbonatum]RVU04977.1 DNA polymerase III subunit delta [Novosphingobium umbonatum]